MARLSLVRSARFNPRLSHERRQLVERYTQTITAFQSTPLA